MRKSGFTLIELLVVIAIIAILAAILFPVFTTAKQQGIKAQCQSNMKQLAQATLMYVDNWNNSIVTDGGPRTGFNPGGDAMNKIGPYATKAKATGVITMPGGTQQLVLLNIFLCPGGAKHYTTSAKGQKAKLDPMAGTGYGWNNAVSEIPPAEPVAGHAYYSHYLGGAVSGVTKPSKTAMWGEVLYATRGWGPDFALQYELRHNSSESFNFVADSTNTAQQDTRKTGGFSVAYWDGHVSFLQKGDLGNSWFDLTSKYLLNWWNWK